MDFQICNLQGRRAFWNLIAFPRMHRWRLRWVSSDSRELSGRYAADNRRLRQRFFVPWLGRWGPLLDLRAVWKHIRTLRNRDYIGTVQLSSQGSWRKRIASWRGMHRRPWAAVRVPQHVDLDANIVQLWAFRSKKVWRRQNCQRVRHEHNVVWSPYSELCFPRFYDARAWRWNRLDPVRPNWLARVPSIGSQSTAAKLMERWLKKEPRRTVQVRQHECAA